MKRDDSVKHPRRAGAWRLLAALSVVGALTACVPPPDPAPVVAGDTAGDDAPADPGRLTADPPALDFAPDDDQLSFEILFDGGFGIDFTVESNAEWLRVAPAAGQIIGGRATIDVEVVRDGLEYGLYAGTLVVRAGTRRVDVSVGMVALADGVGPDLLVTPRRFNFGATADTQALLIYYNGEGSVNYTVAPDRDWITVDPPAGTNSGALERVLVQADRSRLPNGEHNAKLVVRADNGFAAEIPIVVRKDAATLGGGTGGGGGGGAGGGSDGAGSVAWLYAPAALDFGSTQDRLTMTLRRSGDPAADFAAALDAPWARVSPGNGSATTSPAMLEITADRTGLLPGEYTGLLTVASEGAIVVAAPITLTVPDAFAISGEVRGPGGQPLAGVRVRATDGGGTTHTDATGTYRVSVPFGWTGLVIPEDDRYIFEPPNGAFGEVFGDVAGDAFQALNPESVAPSVLITWNPGDARIYDGPLASDDRALVSMSYLGAGQWRLSITNRQSLPIQGVLFPWQRQRAPLGDTNSDDFYYYPMLLGQVTRADEVGEYAWAGSLYPGVPAAPLAVAADGTRARLVSSATWPPVSCWAMVSLDRQTMRFLEPIPPGAERTYTVCVAEVVGDEALGLPPWLLALDPYSAWLRARLTEDGRYPIPVDPTIRRAHGWLNIQLENSPVFPPGEILAKWHEWKQDFPWVQFWGQMSNYAGDSALAVPPLEPNEQTGCCLGSPLMHPRYIPELLSVMDTIKSDGGLVGLYARPRKDGEYLPFDNPTVVDGKTQYQFFADWVARNASEYGANAHYLDVLGARPLGPPHVMFEVYDNIVQPNSVMEYVDDLAPTGFLVSGGLNGGDLKGGPGQTKDTLNAAQRSTTFPPFVRYLLADRVMLLGQSNNDIQFWGAANDHWTERQVFILGCKFDAMNLVEADLPGRPPNAMLVEAVAERNRVNWWERDPQYRDTRGVTEIPLGIEVRHFIDKDGVHLFAIDNWRQLTGRSFRFMGRSIPIPAARISIVEFQP